MINQKEHYVAWVLLITQLDDAKEHLENLIKKMEQDGGIADIEFAIELGHVYAHLNRGWHSRNQESEITVKQLPLFSQFPKDLKPVG